ncbi:24031_t:CDS:2, partial [Racocetra persica]
VSARYEKEEQNRPPCDVFKDPIYLTLNLPPESQWKNILKLIQKEPQNAKKHIHQALQAVEGVKIEGVSLENLTCKERFLDRDLTDYDLQSVINELNEFAAKGGKSGGEFYTPLCV